MGPPNRNAVREQLEKLIQLQRIDNKVREFEEACAALPAKLSPAQRDLVKLTEMLAMEEARIAESEKFKAEQEEFVRRENDNLAKAKLKLQGAQNATEYGAASREVENKRKMISDKETEILKLLEALEQGKKSYEAHKADVETLRSELGTEQAEVEQKIAELKAAAEKEAAGRAEVAAAIDKQLLSRYDRIRKGRGYAVAPVVNGTCQGCHMALQPQLANQLARGDSIEQCSRCQRMIFRADAFPELVSE